MSDDVIPTAGDEAVAEALKDRPGDWFLTAPFRVHRYWHTRIHAEGMVIDRTENSAKMMADTILRCVLNMPDLDHAQIWCRHLASDAFLQRLPIFSFTGEPPITFHGVPIMRLTPDGGVQALRPRLNRMETVQSLATALEAVLLFHGSGAWTDERERIWKKLVGDGVDATRKALCSMIRARLDEAGWTPFSTPGVPDGNE